MTRAAERADVLAEMDRAIQGTQQFIAKHQTDLSVSVDGDLLVRRLLALRETIEQGLHEREA